MYAKPEIERETWRFRKSVRTRGIKLSRFRFNAILKFLALNSTSASVFDGGYVIICFNHAKCSTSLIPYVLLASIITLEYELKESKSYFRNWKLQYRKSQGFIDVYEHAPASFDLMSFHTFLCLANWKLRYLSIPFTFYSIIDKLKNKKKQMRLGEKVSGRIVAVKVW